MAKRLHALWLSTSLLLVSACTSVPQSTYYVFEKNTIWQLSAKAKLEAGQDKIMIYVNQELAITGLLSPQKPKATFQGAYRQYPMTAECELVANGLVFDHHCAIQAQGKSVTHLTF
ncbi:hypothetical protein [Agitococcus lubricus]|uniref:Lipoprotein n=1 Tax=Agitococcus lubricus TaxID=1077255 RepID=A0A2T5IWX3_9GAMM|nr:hypothetical protein [Agitococcus lubricus]PTQ88413.1 hypothetical protein C8N29_11258 [Agitococcus lubricus]